MEIFFYLVNFKLNPRESNLICNIQKTAEFSFKQGDKLPKKCVKLTKTMNKIHNVDKVDIWFYNLFIL